MHNGICTDFQPVDSAMVAAMVCAIYYSAHDRTDPTQTPGRAFDLTIAAGITIAQLLQVAPFGANDNRLLIAHALRLSRTQLITQSHDILDAQSAHDVNAILTRRQTGEPVAYILGSREFYGLSFLVTPAVLIPRAETELLVDLALEHALPGARIADLGTGSGAIAIAIGRNRSDVHITATDISQAALDIARQNAALHRVRATFVCGNWLVALGVQQFDLIVSNPPYIAAGDGHLKQGDLPFEPIEALTDYADGLSALRAIATSASTHLKSGGWLLMEHGYDQADAVRALLAASGFQSVRSWPDLAGINRVSGGLTPAK